MNSNFKCFVETVNNIYELNFYSYVNSIKFTKILNKLTHLWRSEENIGLLRNVNSFKVSSFILIIITLYWHCVTYAECCQLVNF